MRARNVIGKIKIKKKGREGAGTMVSEEGKKEEKEKSTILSRTQNISV